MSRLNGRAALITGGRQGIGRAIVDAFELRPINAKATRIDPFSNFW